ncbi:MAG: Mur ligase family protein [Verrucomicrobiota bacterium]|nr:MAG: Mur ligase family protein [Verrucomicrobiota bacterium]
MEAGNFEDILHFLYRRPNPHSGKWRLDRVIRLFKRLEIRQPPYKIVHVAGTNGKGSTSAMLESIYRHGGYKTGLFTSPHLVSLLERIQIDGHLISKEDFVQTFQTVHTIAENLEQEKPEDAITFFEYMTAIALRYFLEKKVDVAVIEVGLGGRLDPTNALKNTSCSIITTIAFDHEKTLGHTLSAIAREKAGIIKTNGLVVTGRNIQGKVLETIQDVAQARHAALYSSPSNHLLNATTADYQNYNASTAQTVAELLNDKGILPIPNAKILKGIQQFRWPGRWQKIVYQGKTVTFDGAHNEEGAYAVAREIQNLPKPPILIFGSNTVQRAQKMLAILSPICKKPISPRVHFMSTKPCVP